jgi:putative tRNA adenosine deaminase-associated protein
VARFAVVLARSADGWAGEEVDLADVEDLDGLVDLARETAGDDADGPVLLLVEENDEWCGIVRADVDADPRVFLSDRRAASSSEVASLLFDAPDVGVATGDEGGDDESMRPQAEPAGDPDLLADLGTDADTLVELCAEEGRLPADVLAAVCETAGCLDVLETLREG